MRGVFLTACVLAVAVGSPIQDLINPDLDAHWTDYMQQFNKQYKSEVETNIRRVVWERNLKYVQEHNLEADMGMHKHWLGINEHADLTDEEFALYQRGTIMRNESSGSTYLALSNVQLPNEVDWRKRGCVTEVKNQISAIGSVEGQLCKKTGKLVSLSVQQLIDCCKGGCVGGSMDPAFECIKETGGIDSEKSYPYTGKQDTCHYQPGDSAGNVTGFVDIPRGDEDALKEAVATVGPISVAIDAGHTSFQLYKHGVYSDPDCSSTRLDHGVLVVGYGVKDRQKYWLVKNSWGASWGEEGYIMMARDDDNMCGIATMASYPLV